MNLLLESPPPVELERFWASSKNKEELQILSREFFKQKTEQTSLILVLGGHVTDGEGMQHCVMLKAGRIITKKKMKSATEEADSRIIQHLIEAAKCESQRVVVISNVRDAVVYYLIYENRCRFYRYKEVWFIQPS